jgi:hypothetical protein
MKTLAQIEPRIDLATVTGDTNTHHIISQPGSYYLSGKLDVTRTTGIAVNAPGVTIDLNGFRISRTVGTGGVGIQIAQAADGCTVKNGFISGFANGTAVAGGVARGGSFFQLTASNCSNIGLSGGQGWRMEGCTAVLNSGDGISVGPGSTLINCTATGNTSGSDGIGIAADGGSTLINCAAYNNTGRYGIQANGSSTLTNCTARGNTSAASSSAGISAGLQSSVIGCVAAFNTSTNGTLSPSTGAGIVVASASTVKDCTVTLNKGDGIFIDGEGLVTGNVCTGNGLGTGTGAGISVNGEGSRIDGNNTANNDIGIKVAAAGNIIIRNSSRGGTDAYDIAGGNAMGQEINVFHATNLTIINNSNPWANFLY